MATTYTLIDKTTLTGSQNTVSFSSIPTTYTDLLVFYSTRSGRSNTHEQIKLRFNDNGDTAYRIMRLNSDGTTPYSDSDFASYGYCGFGNATTSTSNTFGNTQIYIPNYLSNNYKSYSVDSVSENNATQTFASLQAGLWEKTSAINKITFYADQGNDFLQYSSFYLYGIKNS
jgi:hypothetical protein